MASEAGFALPIHSTYDGVQRHKSKRTRSSNPLQNSDSSKVDRTPKASSSANGGNSSSYNQRPSLTSRTSSTSAAAIARNPSGLDLNTEVQTYRIRDPMRDSVASIKDDPFFRNYQSPQSVSMTKELHTASYSSEDDHQFGGGPLGGTLQRSMTDMNLSKSTFRAGMENINIAVIGASGVGKSTLIQRALGLRLVPAAVVSSVKMSVDNVGYTVSMIELDLESFDISPDRRIEWPKQINGQIVPHVDGALILYDVMNGESITDLPQTLNALVYSMLPTILVSCKCDNPVNARQIDTESIQAACLAEVETVKTASNVPESARLCLGAILRAIMGNRNGTRPVKDLLRRPAGPAAHAESLNTDHGGYPDGHSMHTRTNSEYGLLRGYSSPQLATSRRSANVSRQGASARSNTPQPTIHSTHTAPPLSSLPTFRQDIFQSSRKDDSESLSKVISNVAPGETPANAENAQSSLLDMEESDADSARRDSDDIPILQRTDDFITEKPAKVAGLSFDELVARLLRQHMSKADINFQEIFLCLYRKFAAPGELFSAILDRLDQITDDSSVHYLVKTAAQLRVISVIAKWVSNYPGDFASPRTSQRLDALIGQLAAEPAFAATAQEMRNDLRMHVVEDDDTGWARTDADMEAGSSSEAYIPESSQLFDATGSTDDLQGVTSNPTKADENSAPGQGDRRLSETVSISSGDATSISATRSSVYQTVEDYQAEAYTMVPSSTLPLTKFRFQICMDISDEDFAYEITRIDWVMFSSIRIRDLVRHVSLPLEQKEKCKSLANVNRMISHFNHVARWVSNMILMRDKAKHRALMLEKFMTIALKLRQLNNYNGLAAVIAGINGSAVHRLSQTRALVPAECQKRFMRLELLMSTQKSHFAYRLAWENSSLPRIPFIPLHRRDLVSAEEGSRTFVGSHGDRINWKKFEILSEVLLPIIRSQGTPYANLEKHDIARELILDCRMPTDEEEIYSRSLQLESSSSSMLDTGRKKFHWFHH